jgi:predicted MPP superfamily phosphohydrolase
LSILEEELRVIGSRIGRVTALALLLTRLASAQQVDGTVFVDDNGDGVRGPNERGLAGVVVSDQSAVVRTGTDGTFRLDTSGGHGVIFVSVPNGYRPVGSWWRPAADKPMTFALQRTRDAREFTFVHASDTHMSPQSFPRTERFRAIVDSVKPDFVIVTGDLVKDALRVSEQEATSYYDLVAGAFPRFSAPVRTVPGNHEIFGIERNLSHVTQSHPLYGRTMYRRRLGPDYYSFDYGGVHFIGLNSVDYDEEQSYYGHIDSTQMAWLERDLATVPATTPVVTYNHIPFATAVEHFEGYRGEQPAPTLITLNGKQQFRHVVSNAADVLALFRGRRYAVALGGHMHVRERLSYEMEGVRTRFEQSAAVVGPSDAGAVRFRSGIVFYRVRSGEIDAGTFVPLDPPAKP